MLAFSYMNIHQLLLLDKSYFLVEVGNYMVVVTNVTLMGYKEVVE